MIKSLLTLVVDDNTSCLERLMSSLYAIGIKQVLSATTGAEAVQILSSAKRPVDVVLSDIRMPQGNGLQLLQAIRTGQIRSVRLDATFILVTGTPTVETVKAASALDANGYIVKAALSDKLEAAIQKGRRIVFPANPTRYAQALIPDEL